MKDILLHTHFPYCLYKLEDGSYVALNKNYKPIGYIDDHHGKHYDYKSIPVSITFKRLSVDTVRKLSAKQSDNLDQIYLYDGDTWPTRSAENMQKYLKKLDLLMNLKLKT